MTSVNNRIRTLFIMRNLRGRATLNLLRNIDKSRFEVVFFLMENKGELLCDVPNDVQVVFANDRLKYNKFLFPYYLLKLLPYARRADVVIGAMDHGPTYFAYAAGLLTQKPVIGWVCTILDEILKHENVGRLISRFVYPRLTSIVCPSRAVATSIGRVANVREEQIEVIYNPNDIDLIINRGKEPCPKWYSDIIKKPTLITVARLAYPKGLDVLIKAHERVLRGGIDHNLVICGEGYFREKFEKLVESLGIGSSVLLPGYIANPFPLVKNATAFILSSLHEAFGMVVIEALALGTPIVSTACQGPEEILANGEYGIIVKPGDISSLAEGMSQIFIDGNLRKKLSEKGLERARWFSSENRTADWERLLLRVANKHNKRT